MEQLSQAGRDFQNPAIRSVTNYLQVIWTYLIIKNKVCTDCGWLSLFMWEGGQQVLMVMVQLLW
jgi:hypothetical protein